MPNLEDKYIYVEMACPPEVAESIIKGMEVRHQDMLDNRIMGEWRDRSYILTADNFSFKDMLFIDPANGAFILHDYRVMRKEGENPRVFLQILPLNGKFFSTWNPNDWVFIPRIIVNKKSGVTHFITVDIKKKVDDPNMMADAQWDFLTRGLHNNEEKDGGTNGQPAE